MGVFSISPITSVAVEYSVAITPPGAWSSLKFKIEAKISKINRVMNDSTNKLSYSKNKNSSEENKNVLTGRFKNSVINFEVQKSSVLQLLPICMQNVCKQKWNNL